MERMRAKHVIRLYEYKKRRLRLQDAAYGLRERES